MVLSRQDSEAGAGTLLLAAEKVGRVAHVMEYEAGYVDAAIVRWQRFTKHDAVLFGDGRTFEDLAVDRK